MDNRDRDQDGDGAGDGDGDGDGGRGLNWQLAPWHLPASSSFSIVDHAHDDNPHRTVGRLGGRVGSRSDETARLLRKQHLLMQER